MPIKISKMHKKPNKKAFSLIELSIVILIISILVSGSIGISKTAINNSKNKITKERMDVVYKAITSFVANNRRLPCPARLDLSKGTAGYGNETTTPGTCTGSYLSSNTGSNTNIANLVYGAIPSTALGLSPDMAEDGFGTKFSYVVDKRFTLTSASTSSTNGFEVVKAMPQNTGTTPTIIKVQASGTDIMINALFVLISHGSNKYNGFNASGTSQNPANLNIVDENTNGCNGGGACSTTATSDLFTGSFVVYSNSSAFDDWVLFKNKTQLISDAGLEFMMCSFNEAVDASGYTFSSSQPSYGYNSCGCSTNTTGSGATYYAGKKTCGKYGIWGSVSTVFGTTSANATNNCKSSCP